MNEVELFAKAIEITNPAERHGFLDRECAGKPEWRERIDQLLDAHLGPNPWLDSSNRNDDTTKYPQAETAGMLIAGRYKLLEQIGEGAMGSVWMADQTEPVKRRVAVKLIRTERGNSKTILARFDAERQAIALMDHPHIARLLDAGSTETGSPFFVMELVKGIPLNQYCDLHQMSIPDRLLLFMQICSAVQHAHQKGIIHRDIKPSNILVELHDDKPVPKVIDFGLAKATRGLHLTENTLFTGFGTVMGTPLYMSPEQAKFNATDIDTRADIYALGVVLYELLTGSTPLTKETIKKAALDEMMKLVREQEAPTPSSRLSSSVMNASVSAHRQAEPAKLSRFIQGELDWIVMKAISKERDRRYQTANGFAQDIERFLNHEPVTACPPSTWYRVKKFVQRNRGRVFAAGLMILALLAGVIGTTLGWWEAKKQAVIASNNEEIAKTERSKAEAAALAETAAKEQALKRLTQIEKGNKLLQTIFAELDIENVRHDIEPLEAVLAKRLVNAARQLEGDSIGDTLVVASLQHQLGSSLRSLGFTKEAIPLLEASRDIRRKSLGDDHIDTLETMNELAQSFLAEGYHDNALVLHQDTLKLRAVKLGAEHPETLNSTNNLALTYKASGQNEMALPLHRKLYELRKRKLGADHLHTLTSMHNLAASLKAAGQNHLALPLYEEVLKRRKAIQPPDHIDVINSMNNLAASYQAAGKEQLAHTLFEEILKLRKARLGADHPDTFMGMNNLALSYRYIGRNDLALPLHQETLRLQRAKLGADHPATHLSMNNLVESYLAAGQNDLAIPLAEETLKIRKEKRGIGHPDTLHSMVVLGASYQAAGKNELALPLLEDSFQRTSVKWGADHPDTIMSMGKLASGYRAIGQFDKAIPLFEAMLRWRRANLDADHPHTLSSMNSLASAYWSAKQLDKSIPLFEEALKLREKKLGRQHPDTLVTIANLGVNYKDAGRLKNALPLLEEAYAASTRHPILQFAGLHMLDARVQTGEGDKAVSLVRELEATARRSLPLNSVQLASELSKLGAKLLLLHRFVAAEPLLRDALVIREKLHPDDWNTYQTQSMLGGVLLGQKKFAEAEPLLLKGYEGLKQQQRAIPPASLPRIHESIDRLIHLYTETNKPDEAKKYQAERMKYQPSAPGGKQ